MNQVQLFNEEILDCIFEIEMYFPELYYLLEETPFKGINSNQLISIEALEDYFNTLKEKLNTFRINQTKLNFKKT
ncbi:hypothetical protein [Bizionia arctica]|uniref:Uncharacterized protein n=1 Tax=Bizionia arctica TaxID=1495645 RepID=A0A917GKK0_9FLAO|nr:hypothetical protein [Bizionia arctica]GGG49394.1 hypothetical protein GCM10010976_20880 [Bizionia arctica]